MVEIIDDEKQALLQSYDNPFCQLTPLLCQGIILRSLRSLATYYWVCFNEHPFMQSHNFHGAIKGHPKGARYIGGNQFNM